MIPWLLVARSNDYGLTRDAALLRQAIADIGGESGFAEKRQRGLLAWLVRRRQADCILHIERAFPRWFSAAPVNWLIPNQERFPRRHVGRLKRMDRVLVKSRHAEKVFAPFARVVTYLGFTSEDRRDPAVAKDFGRFFHLAGGSTLKGTETLIELWSAHPEWPELTLVQKAANAPSNVPSNVRLLSGYIDDAALKQLQNACGVHLCPSRAEGWGHHIVEGLSTGAVVLTTDAPPMNELVDAGSGILVGYDRSVPRHLGTEFFVARGELERAIARVIAMPDKEKAAIGHAARQRYEAIDSRFRARVAEIFGRSAGSVELPVSGVSAAGR